jgi:hypothetical protein
MRRPNKCGSPCTYCGCRLWRSQAVKDEAGRVYCDDRCRRKRHRDERKQLRWAANLEGKWKPRLLVTPEEVVRIEELLNVSEPGAEQLADGLRRLAHRQMDREEAG